jgi:hypothetical protein
MTVAGLPQLSPRDQKLNQKNNFLRRLNKTVPWQEFRPILEQVRQKPRKSNAGRKSFDVVRMFKLLLLQKLYNISDEQLEYQVNDRLSFMQFLGVNLTDAVPDATTVGLFRQQISKEEKEQLDKGEIPQDWQDNPERLSQRDIDASWTKKNNVSHFGYKDHISVDVEHGFVRNYSVTDAAAHDSIPLADILS